MSRSGAAGALSAAAAATLLALALAIPAAADAPAGGLGAAVLARLARAGGPLPADRAVAVRFVGTLELEGHYSRPHEVNRFHSVRRIAIAAPGIARQDWTTWSDDDTTRSTETTLLLPGRVLVRDEEGGTYQELAGRSAAQAAYAIYTAAPALAAARALQANGRGLAGGPRTSTLSIYDWPDSIGRVQVYLDAFDQPTAWTTFIAEPRLGSLTQNVNYYACGSLGERVWPDSLRSEGLPEGATWILREGRAGGEEPVALAELAAPGHVEPAPAPADTVPRVVAVSPGVWAVELADADTRSLAVEFAHELVLLESSCDVPHGERIRAALRERFPRKPVRRVAFSHYHPDYTGGLRAFLADSVRVVCPGALAGFVQEIAHQNFTVSPDRLARSHPGGVNALVDTLVAGRWSVSDATNELVAIDIGALSHHTDHYVIFWLPRARLLFEGDLGYFTSNGAVRASRRAAGLLQAVDDAHLDPLTVIQSWPVRGNPPSLPFAKLRELAAAAKQ